MDSLQRSKHEQIHNTRHRLPLWGRDTKSSPIASTPQSISRLEHTKPAPYTVFLDRLGDLRDPWLRECLTNFQGPGPNENSDSFYKIIKNFVNVDLPQPPHWPSSLQPLFNSIVLALIYVISLIPTSLTQYHLPGLLAPWTPCP